MASNVFSHVFSMVLIIRVQMPIILKSVNDVFRISWLLQSFFGCDISCVFGLKMIPCDSSSDSNRDRYFSISR